MNWPTRSLALALTISTFAAPALATSAPTTRLISCQTGSCLVVSGRRSTPAALVLINGHAIPVEGQRNWQARLSLDTVRAWSEPMARTLAVETVDPATAARSQQEALLPIGLLGHADLDVVLVAFK